VTSPLWSTPDLRPLLSTPDLRPLLFIGFVSYVVRWLQTLAVALFAYRITDSAFMVAIGSMLRLLPMGLFGAFIGGVAACPGG